MFRPMSLIYSGYYLNIQVHVPDRPSHPVSVSRLIISVTKKLKLRKLG